MDFISELWMPIVISAVAAWIISAIIWMFMPHRKSEWAGLPDEAGFLNSLKSMQVKPGNYMFPYAGPDCARMKEDSFKAMLKEGPVGTVTVWNGTRNMGANMLASFIFNLVTSTFVAYLAWQAFGGRPDPGYLNVFQFTATATFMAYTFALIPMGIWFNKPVKNMMYDVIDGLVGGLVTGGVFGWLWPHIETIMNGDLSGAIPG